MSEFLATQLALKWSVNRLLQHVVVKMNFGLESLITVLALKVSNILVDRVDVSLKSALLREVLPAEFTPYL